MSIVIGFAPWIVYWVLVGNVPFETAVLVALAVAVAGLVIGRVHKAPGITFEIGAVATFLALTILTFTVSRGFMERWLQPLSNVGIFLVALGGVLVGRPFVREFAEAGFRFPRRHETLAGGERDQRRERRGLGEHPTRHLVVKRRRWLAKYVQQAAGAAAQAA